MEKRIDIYEHFKLYCRVADDEVDYWDYTPGMTHEITVHMRNGDIITFDDFSLTFRYRREFERNENGDYELSDEEYRKAFGDKLRRLTISRRMSQRQLSDVTGISTVQLSHYMNGRNLPDIRNARRLARVFECSIDELLELY